MEWGIGGLKRKWKGLIPHRLILFKATTILTIFLHRHRIDFAFEVICKQLPNLINHGWDRDL